MITEDKEYWDNADVGNKLALVFHELLHVPVGGFDPESKSFRKVVDHDIQDFSLLLQTYGVTYENVYKLADMVPEDFNVMGVKRVPIEQKLSA